MAFSNKPFRGKREPAARVRLSCDLSDHVVYAVGDVHGCLDELLALESEIIADAAKLPGRKTIVMLGDYIDRGPASSGVLDHLLAPPPEGFDRICLCGNHEVAMLDFAEGRIERRQWVAIGGAQTLLSYGIDETKADYGGPKAGDELLRSRIPAAHLAFLREMPVLLQTPNYLFVHAGIRPGVPIDKQTDREMTTLRSKFADTAHLLEQFVVHGHTPVTNPSLDGRHLNIDTGAYFSGRLTGVRIWRNTGKFLTGVSPQARRP